MTLQSITGQKRRFNRHRGQALVPVVLVVVILTVLAVAFTTSSSREIRASSNFNSETERFYAARGAMNYVMSALSNVSNNGATYGIVPPGPDTDANGWMQMGDAWVKIEVVDTAACANLNSVTATTLNQIPVFQQNPDLAASIIDWRTPGETASTNGAKSDYYQTLLPPYNAKDAPFDSVEELLLVKEITPAILYGTPAGTPVTPDANARQGAPGATVSASSGSQSSSGGGSGATGSTGAAAATTGDTDWTDVYSSSALPLSELFTAMSMEKNVAADGSARVNINTATAQDLQNIGLSSTLANALVKARQPATTTPGGGGAGGGKPGAGGTGGKPGAGGNGGKPGAGGNGAKPGAGGAGGSNTTGGGSNGGGNSGGATNGGGTSTPGGNGGGGARPGQRSTRQAGGGGNATPGGNPTGNANGGGSSMPGGNGGNGGAGGNGGNNGNGGNTGNSGSAGGSTSTVFKNIGSLMTVQGFTQSVMQQIADHITVDTKPFHAGLVNVNTAPAEVLAMVPGMDHATLQAILDYRQGGQAFQGLGDIFALQGVTRQEFQNVLGGLCTKSSIYKVHIKVRTQGQQGVYAVSAVIQLTDSGPQVIQWHETPRTPGWSYWSAPSTLPTPTPSSGASGTSTGG